MLKKLYDLFIYIFKKRDREVVPGIWKKPYKSNLKNSKETKRRSK